MNLWYDIQGDEMKTVIKELKNVQYLKDKYHLSSLCAKVLAYMELTEEEIDEIIKHDTDLNDLSFPLLDKIIQRFQKAKEQKEKVLVCGDYDCDGICATSILSNALEIYGIDCGYYIPNRFKEGYGLHVNTVELAHKKGYSLLVTVDNGVKALDALTLAKEYNIDVILSDHHNYEEDELICDLFLHPNILPKQFKGMCGAGLAYLMSYALIGYHEKHAVLAGIATIGDVVPLRRVNRALVKRSIDLLNAGKYFAIQSLANDRQSWDEKKIAYQIVPKLNSIGRLADRANANNVVRFLCSDDANIIQDMVVQINQLNGERKELSSLMEERASALIQKEDNFHVLYDESFHEGINGIVASRFVNKLQQPVMVLSQSEGILKGSIRSNSVDLTNFFDDLKDSLISYGGHKEAAGIAFAKEQLSFIKNYCNDKLVDYDEDASLSVLPLDKKEVTMDEILSLDQLKPFGCGFELPPFMIHDDSLEIVKMSNGKHLKYVGSDISYVYFNSGERYAQDKNKQIFTFVGSLEINYFRNNRSINMLVDHIID